MIEKGMYYVTEEFAQMIRSVGGVWNDPKHRPFVCLIKSKENDELFWAIPMGKLNHRDNLQKKRLDKYLNFPRNDIRSCYYHIGRTTSDSIFFVSDVVPVTDKYIEEPHFGADGKPFVVKNPQITSPLQRKLYRVLSLEKNQKNHFRQHITDIKEHLLDEIRNSYLIIKDGIAIKCTYEKIEKVKVPDNVYGVRKQLFENFKSLRTVEFSDNVEQIGRWAFFGCDKLETVKLPKSLKLIREGVFQGCQSLKIIDIPWGVSGIDYGAFANCSSLENVTIPNGVEVIGEGAFYNCQNLNHIVIPDSVTKIDNRAFENCINLRDVTISDKLLKSIDVLDVFKNTPFGNNWGGGDGDGAAVKIEKEVECVFEENNGNGRGR